MALIALVAIETKTHLRKSKDGAVIGYDIVEIRPGETVEASEAFTKADIAELVERGVVIDQGDLPRVELPPPLQPVGVGNLDESEA